MPSQNYVQSLKNKFFIKRDDTLPALGVQLIQTICLGEKVPYNLSAVTACTFTMLASDGNVQISEAPAQIVSQSGGTLSYAWQNGDTMYEGIFYGTFQMYFSGGSGYGGKMSVPQIGNINIYIGQDINPFDT
jgi:hypothetical protein